MDSVRNAAIGMVLGVAVATSTGVSARQPAAGGDLSVTVNYRGKSPVSKGHEIGVFLFDTPDIGGPYKPIAIKVLETNGGTAHFTGLTAATVYVAVSYDESGKHIETQDPPPPGAPVAVLGIKGDPNLFFAQDNPIGKPTGLRPGPGAKVTMTFDDVYRSK